MSMERLSHQIDAYVAWKRELMREITRYRGWLERSRLNSPAVEAKLERALRQLRADHITLAFVGEFSRGKTELINSLFFAGYGQRMLPSHAGRTTMCPTELFHDPRAERSCIRLLPIETRLADASVAQFKRVPRHWVNIPLDTGDPEGMAQAFAQVAKTKALPVEQAIQLGFHPDALEAADEPDQVRVPAWRHALVNFDHPLLRQGLRILDTPGLNALGSEPELTLSMLPNAQAILFLLSADAGVTASDMEIWQKYIQPLREDGHSSLFAVLNKIDVLWDDLSGERFGTERHPPDPGRHGPPARPAARRRAAAVGEAGAAGQGPRRTGAARTQSPGSAGSAALRAHRRAEGSAAGERRARPGPWPAAQQPASAAPAPGEGRGTARAARRQAARQRPTAVQN